MKLLVFTALFWVVACKSVMFDENLDEYWDSFKRVFGKSYEAREETLRRLIWEKHVSEIFRHNMQANMGLHSFHQGLNKYSDMTPEERVQKMKGVRQASTVAASNASTWLAPLNLQAPKSVDWREKGLVTPVKDQGRCGSCWAFSSTGSLEGQHKRKTGKLVSLSEQNLVDCSRDEGNGGCNGGWMDYAFDYVMQNKGIDREDSYPYTAEVGECHYSRSDKGATCSGYVDLPTGDEGALKKAVAAVGPISVAISVEDDFFHYRDGVYDTPECGNTMEDLGHAVLVVGYGTEKGKDYWLVKNSWGASWGINGYVKMSRNKDNQCGIATKASYPLV